MVGKPADIAWYPPTDDEKKQKLGQFFQTTAAPPKTVARVPDTVKSIAAEYKGIETWGIVGFCWGGKVSTVDLQE